MQIIEPSFKIIAPNPFNEKKIMKFIEEQGRVCYRSHYKAGEDTAKLFTKKIIQNGHHSVLEHVNFTIQFVCDRGVSHELVRHRFTSISQQSTRYVNYAGEEIKFVRPYGYEDWDQNQKRLWLFAMSKCEDTYKEMVKSGLTPQQARAVLPNSLATEIVMTCNLRELRHILKLRTSKKAHPDMRYLMIFLMAELSEEMPNLFDDLED